MIIFEITKASDGNVTRFNSTTDIVKAKQLITEDVKKNGFDTSDLVFSIKSVRDRNKKSHLIDVGEIKNIQYRIWHYQAKDI